MHRNREDLYLTVAFILSVAVLSLVKVHDVDAWLHLSLGRLIVDHRGIPDKEVFTFAAPEMPFFYTSWLFGVTSYLSNQLFGVLGLNILKSACVSGAFIFLLRDAARPHRNYAMAVLVLIFAATFSQHRFVLRPDIFFMLFLSFNIFALNAYLYDGKKYLYALPFVSILWANSHSSISIIALPFLAFLFGGILQHFLVKRGIGDIAPSAKHMKVILALLIISMTATLLNPFFWDQITYGYDVLSSGWYKSVIKELEPPSGVIRHFLVIGVAIILLSFILNRRRFSFIHFFLVLPFIVLSFTAIRFIFLPALVGAPIFTRNLSGFIKDTNLQRFTGKPLFGIVSLCLVVTLTILSVLHIGPFGNDSLQYGVGFDYDRVPQKAVEYMDRTGIEGNVFNTFQFGQYIIWTGYPKRKIFFDGRGHIPLELLERLRSYRRDPGTLNKLSDDLNFEILLIRHSYPEDRNDMFHNPNWALVYWDDISLLYLKRGGTYRTVIENDEYISVKPDMSFSAISSNISEHLRDPFFVESFVRELKRNISESGSARARIILGILYNASGQHRQAVEVLASIEPTWLEDFNYEKAKGLGYAYAGMGQTKMAISFYKEALKEDDTAEIYFLLGSTYYSAANHAKAVHYLEQAIQKDNRFVDAYPMLIKAYRSLGKARKAARLQETFDSLLK